MRKANRNAVRGRIKYPDPDNPGKSRMGKKPGTKVHLNSLLNLNLGPAAAAMEKPIPVLTAEIAAEYVKLRASGLPPADAVLQFTPKGIEKYPLIRIKEWVDLWESSGLVAAAWEVWNGGTWESLDRERRLELALDHHLAQMAYCLYTADYNDKDANLRKLADARDAITAALEHSHRGESARFDAFLKAVITSAEAGLPPIAIGQPLLDLSVSVVKES